ncbi:hypothetical protein ACQPZJ_14380 [Actinoplanes sp. CA-054009]
MFDQTDLPPSRPLPPAVRAAARRRLTTSMAGARSGRAAVAVAMAVTAVAFGATLLNVVRSGPADVPATGDSSPRAFDAITPEQRYAVRDGAAADDAGRCRRAGAGGPPLFSASRHGSTVVAFRSPEGARFCELTPETVSLSVPAASAGDSAKVTYVSRFGTVAGVVTPAVPHLSVADPDLRWPMTDEGEPAVVRDGAFVLPNAVTAAPGALTLHLGATADRDPAVVTAAAAQLPAAVAPHADRPQPSPGAGDFARCADQAGVPPLIDAHAWRPAATVRLTGNERLTPATYGGMLSVCLVTGADGSDGTARLTVSDQPGMTSPLSVFYDFAGYPDGSSRSGTIAVAGLVTDERVVTVTLTGPGRRPVTAAVDDRTFVLPGVLSSEGPMTISGYDRTGALLTTAPIPAGG